MLAGLETTTLEQCLLKLNVKMRVTWGSYLNEDSDSVGLRQGSKF